MKRLVYSPYVQAFINADDGVIDVSPYIVRGSINRKVNQVSSAQLTLRNPAQGSSNRLLFTEYSVSGEPPHPMFHPMDPIIIVMQRIAGQPVQVFTGYLDSAPYFQLFPGLCSVSASCTLKRLLYTQWDASLPSVQTFLAQFGWEPNGSGVWNLNADSTRVTGADGKVTSGQFTDGSIGALLFAVMNVIGDWDASTIWIEALPPQIKEIVVNLYQKIAPEVQAGESEFASLLQQVLGTAAQGGGAPGTLAASGTLSGKVTVKGQAPTAAQTALITQVLGIATANNAPKLAVEALLEACIQEHDFTNAPGGTGSSNGLLQVTASTASSLGISAFDVNACVTVFLKQGFAGAGGAIAIANAQPTLAANAVAQLVQDSGAGSADAGASTYGAWLSEADNMISAYRSSATTSSNLPANAAGASTAPAATASTSAYGGAQLVASLAGASPGGKTGTSSGAASAATSLAGVAAAAQAALQRQQTTHCFNYNDERPFPLDLTTGTVTIDCSGFAIDCYKQAGLPDPSHNNYSGQGYTGDMITHAKQVDASAALPGDLGFYGTSASNTNHVTVYVGNGQAVSMGQQGDPDIGPIASMGDEPFLGHYRSDVSGAPVSATASTTTAASGGGTGMAAAFSAMINLPSVLSQAEALILTGKRSFIADSPLFPFIDQLAQASMRNYMSMPNGNFFAFFPDYFGFFGRKYYWEIRDIEIIDGRIDLSDDPLLTHMGVAGDVTTYSGEVTAPDLYLTAGIFDIFDAFTTGYVGQGSGTVPTYGKISDDPVNSENTKAAALSFLQIYGARPYVEEVPAIRSPFYELFLAFQNFMLAWSKQYSTTFELTFMPELFPGGLIGLVDHDIQLYVEEVSHSFDYEQGFSTMATLSSPSKLNDDTPANISAGLARPTALNYSTPGHQGVAATTPTGP